MLLQRLLWLLLLVWHVAGGPTPTTAAPTPVPTPAPTTLAPTTQAPTLAPTTAEPTRMPTTASPTTLTPTSSPTTPAPTTSPTTPAPTTNPTTHSPTLSPTTRGPTLSPTTYSPTRSPTTRNPTTISPTPPTTRSPTTQSPTASPTPVYQCPYSIMTPAQSIEVEDCSGKISLKNGFGLAVWVRVMKTGTNKHIFHAQPLNASVSNVWFGVIIVGDDAYVSFGSSGANDGTSPNWKFISNGVPDTKWMHMAVSWDAVRTVTAYRDSSNQWTSPSISATLVGNERITIGKGYLASNVAGTSQGWDGLMSQFTLYNRVLTYNEVRGLYNPGATGYFAPLPGLLLMLYEDMSNNRLSDISPNAFPLMMTAGNINIGNNRSLTICNAPQFCGSSPSPSCLRAEYTACATTSSGPNVTSCPQWRGLCVDTGSGTKCQCAPGYFGPNCTTTYTSSSCDPTRVPDSYASFSGGSSDFIQVDDCTLDLSATDFSISFWAQPTLMNQTNPVFSTGDRQLENAIFVYFYPAGLQFGFGTSGSNAISYYYRCIAPNGIGYASKAWHFITARFQKASKTLDIYFDGQSVSTTTSSTVAARYAPLLIGKMMNGGTSYVYNGWLDEFRIHQRALASSEMSSMFAGSTPNNNNLVAFFHFNDGIREASTRVGGSFISNAGLGVLTLNSMPVCRTAATCNPDTCGGNGVCGAIGSSAVCSCYNTQGYFSPVGNASVCTSFKNPQTSCIDGVNPTPSTAFRSTADCIELKPCSVQITSGADFSVEVWFRRSDTNRSVIFSKGAYPSNMFLGFDANSSLQFGWGSSVISHYCRLTQSGWHHAVGVLGGSNLYLYLDGALVMTLGSSAMSNNVSDSLYLGCTGNPTPNYPFVGYLSMLHIYSRALSAADVASHFNNIFNATNSANMILDLPLDGDFLSKASAAHTQSLHVTYPVPLTPPDVSSFPLCLDTSQNPCTQGKPCGPNGDCRPGNAANGYTCLCRPGYFGTNCASSTCPATYNQFLDLSDGASSLTAQTCDVGGMFSSGAFTLMAWVKAASNATWPAGVVSAGDVSTIGLGLGFSSARDIVFGWGTGSTATATLRCSAGEDWHLLVGVYSGTTLTLYMDGISVSANGIVAPSLSGIRDLSIGVWQMGVALQYFTGQVDEVRVFKEALTLTAVLNLQTNILPVTNNLVLYLPMNGLIDLSLSKIPVISNSSSPNLFPPASSTRSLCFNTSPCTPNPCQANGLCLQTSNNSFTCVCAPGYNGTTCSSTWDVNTVCPAGQSKFAYGVFAAGVHVDIELADSPLFIKGSGLTGITYSLYLYPTSNSGIALNYANVFTLGSAFPNALVVGYNGTTKLTGCGFPYQNWRHYTVTISSAGNMTLYVGGNFFKSVLLTTDEQNIDLSAFPFLTLGSASWSGYMSNLRVYRRLLSPSEVASLAASSLPGAVDILIPFTARDSSFPSRHAGGVLDYSSSSPWYVRNYGVTVQDSSPTHCRAAGTDPCSSQPCFFGACAPTSATTYNCTCFKGWTGLACADGTSLAGLQCPRAPYIAQGYVEFGAASNASLQVAGCGLKFNKKSFTFSAWVLRNVDGIYSDSLFRLASLAFRFRKPDLRNISYFEYTLNNASFSVLLSGWNGWRHIAGTFNYNSGTDNGTMSLYLDGKAVVGGSGTKRTVPVAGSLYHQGKDVYIGPGNGNDYNYDTLPDYLQGGMSDVRFYDTLLTDPQILYLYDSTISGASAPSATNLQIHMLMTNTTEQNGLAEVSPNFRGVNFERYLLRVDNTRDVTPRGNLTLSQTLPLCRAPNPCYPNPCMRGACIVNGGTYSCQCTPTFTGATCAVPINRTSTCVTGTSKGHTQFGLSGLFPYALTVPRCELDFLQSFTVAGWFYPFTSDQQAWTLFTAASGPRLIFQNNTLLWGISDAANVTFANCKVNQWIHFAAVFDSAGSTVRLYINGVFGVSGPASPGAPVGTSAGTVLVGQQFHGYMAEVCLFQRVLTALEITNLQTNMFDRYDPDLVLRLPLAVDTRDYSIRGALVQTVPSEIGLTTDYPLCFPSTACLPDPCNGQGVCSETGGGTCRCFPGFYGARCNNTYDYTRDCLPGYVADAHAKFGAGEVLSVDGSATRLDAGFTISMFVRIEGAAANFELLSNAGLGINLQWTSSQLQFTYSPNSISTPLWCRILEKWTHISATFNRTSGVMTIYVDEAVRVKQTFSVGNFPAVTPANQFQLGTSFVGRMDEVRFYTRPLSTSELSAIRQGNASVAGLDFYLPMSNSTNATMEVTDQAGTELYTPKMIDLDAVPIIKKRVTGAVPRGLLHEYPMCFPINSSCFPNLCVFGTCKPYPATLPPTANPDAANWLNPPYNPSWTQPTTFQCVCFPGYTGPLCDVPVTSRTCVHQTQYAQFSGGESATVPSTAMSFGNPGFAISFWANVPTPTSAQSFLTHGGGTVFSFQFLAGGTLSFGVSGASATVPLGSAVAGEWHHYAATHRATGGGGPTPAEYVIFVDGVPVASSGPTTWFSFNTANPTTLFSGFAGKLDDFRIQDVSISNTDAATQYMTASYDPARLRLWLPFGSHEFGDLFDNSPRSTAVTFPVLPAISMLHVAACLDVRVAPGSVVPLSNAGYGAWNNRSWCAVDPCDAIFAYHDSVLGFGMMLVNQDSNGLPLPPMNGWVGSIGFMTATFGRLFPCVTSTMSRIYQSATAASFTCSLPVAGGDELQFVIDFCPFSMPCRNNTLIPLNNSLLRGWTNTTFRYPKPTIDPVSLLRTSVAGEPKVPLNRWTAKKKLTAENFTFTGSYFLTDPSLMRVFYGPPENRTQYLTSLIFGDSQYPFNETEVFFSTDPTATGFDLAFTVDVAGVLVTGTDTYAYPEVPEVWSVSGCNNTIGNSTYDCPTYGQVVLTIIGKGFVSQQGTSALQLFADVSGVACTNISLNSSSMLTCILPPGAGLHQVVRVYSLGFFSYPQSLVNYGNPQIFGLKGGTGNVTDLVSCANYDPLNLHHCPRFAGTRLTVSGQNFGVRGAVIILGVRQCVNVTHTDPIHHSEVQCSMPKGNQQHQPVLLIVDRGEISKSPATIGYAPCPPGFFENSTTLLCDACGLGFYTPTEGALGFCSPCPAGSVSTTTGSSVCALCNKGQFQDQPGQTSCTNCQAGKYAGVPGLDECVDCAPGKANNGSDGSLCAPCVQGRYQPLSGQSNCDACPAGKTSNSELLACAQCVPGSAAPLEAATQCVLCPANSYSSQGTINCECETGMYGYFNSPYTLEANPDKVICARCPRGAACNRQGIWGWNIPALPGYWHLTHDSLNFVPCLFGTHCPGQFATNDTGCAANRFGLLCANCKPGFKSTGGAAPCDACPEAVGESWGWSLLFVIAIFAGLAVIYAIVLRADAQQDRAFSGKAGEVKLSSLPPILNMGDAGILTTNVVLTEENQRTSRFTSTMKIVVGFFQICTSLSVFNDVKLPSYYATFIGVFNVINLDFVPWTSLSCVANLNFFNKVLLTGFIPVVLLGSCTAGFFGWYKYADSRDFSDDARLRKQRKGYRLKFWKLLLFTLFLLYPSVSSTVLKYFVCREINSSYWLLADLNMLCGPGIWLDNLPYTCIFVLVYPIGIPAMFFILMFRRRTKLRRVNTIQTYSFLYQAYVEKVWFFEEIEMIHKLFMTSILQFFPGQSRFQAGMVVTFVYICCILVISPYVQKKNEILAIICEIEIMLLLLAGNAMEAEGQLPVGSFLDILLSILLICATIFAFLLFIATAIHHARQNYWTKKRLSAERAGKRNRPKSENEMSETSVVSSNSVVSEIDDGDMGESDNIKSAREAQEAMQDALQSTLSERIAPFHVVLWESIMNIWEDIRRKPCCEAIMKRVHWCGDPAANWLKRGWDQFIAFSQSAFSRLGCIKCASQFRRLTCGTCCEKRKAGKPKLYTSAMMELMLPESRHQRSASEHLLHTSDFARRELHQHHLEEDDDGKLDIAVAEAPASTNKVLRPALRLSVDTKPSKPRKMTVDEKQTLSSPDKPSKPRKLTVDERQAVVDSAPEAPGSRRTTATEEKKSGEPSRQAEAAVSLAAKMAAKLAMRGTSTGPVTTTTTATASPPSSPSASTTPATTSSSSSTTTTPASSTPDDVEVVPPENRVLTKSIAEGRPNKPVKPGRTRNPTTS